MLVNTWSGQGSLLLLSIAIWSSKKSKVKILHHLASCVCTFLLHWLFPRVLESLMVLGISWLQVSPKPAPHLTPWHGRLANGLCGCSQAPWCWWPLRCSLCAWITMDNLDVEWCWWFLHVFCMGTFFERINSGSMARAFGFSWACDRMRYTGNLRTWN